MKCLHQLLVNYRKNLKYTQYNCKHKTPALLMVNYRMDPNILSKTANIT